MLMLIFTTEVIDEFEKKKNNNKNKPKTKYKKKTTTKNWIDVQINFIYYIA